MVRVVIDTNVLVSSFLSTSGPPRRIRELFRSGGLVWCLSAELHAEYRRVLLRPRIQRLFSPSGRLGVERFLSELETVAVWARRPLDVQQVIASDPDDDIVLATALATGAESIISGDSHLLAMGSYRGVSILSPRGFFETL